MNGRFLVWRRRWFFRVELVVNFVLYFLQEKGFSLKCFVSLWYCMFREVGLGIREIVVSIVECSIRRYNSIVLGQVLRGSIVRIIGYWVVRILILESRVVYLFIIRYFESYFSFIFGWIRYEVLWVYLFYVFFFLKRIQIFRKSEIKFIFMFYQVYLISG